MPLLTFIFKIPLVHPKHQVQHMNCRSSLEQLHIQTMDYTVILQYNLLMYIYSFLAFIKNPECALQNMGQVMHEMPSFKQQSVYSLNKQLILQILFQASLFLPIFQAECTRLIQGKLKQNTKCHIQPLLNYEAQ